MGNFDELFNQLDADYGRACALAMAELEREGPNNIEAPVAGVRALEARVQELIRNNSVGSAWNQLPLALRTWLVEFAIFYRSLGFFAGLSAMTDEGVAEYALRKRRVSEMSPFTREPSSVDDWQLLTADLERVRCFSVEELCEYQALDDEALLARIASRPEIAPSVSADRRLRAGVPEPWSELVCAVSLTEVEYRRMRDRGVPFLSAVG